MRQLAPGAIVGDYRIESVLGEGGFGITYRAREDAGAGAPVALKEYFPAGQAVRGPGEAATVHPLGDGQVFRYGLDRFFDEAMQLARLRHPGVVAVRRVFPANGTGYMALDLIAGGTLRQRVRRDGRLTGAALEGLASGLIEALRYLHGEGVLHRDLSPNNLLWVPDGPDRATGRPVLIDFGSARQLVAERSRTLFASVTPGYSPPEMYATGGARGPWNDIYAAAATLHYAASGQDPVESVLRRELVQDGDPDPQPPPPEESPAWLRDLVASGLALSVRRRPADIAAWVPPGLAFVFATPRAVGASPAGPPPRDFTAAPGPGPIPSLRRDTGRAPAPPPAPQHPLQRVAGAALFISHASADRAAAEALVAAIEALGQACWIAPRDVRPGQEFPEQIVRAIRESRGVVLLLSTAANRSRYVARELERAAHFEKPLIPLRLERVAPGDALSLFVGPAHWLEADGEPVAETARRVLAALPSASLLLRPGRGRGKAPAPPPPRRHGRLAHLIPRRPAPSPRPVAGPGAGAAEAYVAATRDRTRSSRQAPPDAAPFGGTWRTAWRALCGWARALLRGPDPAAAAPGSPTPRAPPDPPAAARGAARSAPPPPP